MSGWLECYFQLHGAWKTGSGPAGEAPRELLAWLMLRQRDDVSQKSKILLSVALDPNCLWKAPSPVQNMTRECSSLKWPGHRSNPCAPPGIVPNKTRWNHIETKPLHSLCTAQRHTCEFTEIYRGKPIKKLRQSHSFFYIMFFYHIQKSVNRYI